MTAFSSYQSPFSWRYGSSEMRELWSEEHKRQLWRKLWVVMAEVQIEWGLVSRDQVDELKKHMTEVDVPHALEIEKTLHHDLMAEIKVFAAQCPKAARIIHLGATSMDIKDNAEILQILRSIEILLPKLAGLLRIMAGRIEEFAGLAVMAYTHLQPAEPTTLGYRLAGPAQDLLLDYAAIKCLRAEIKGKGFKGAVGNAASYMMLYGPEGQQRFESLISQALELPFFDVTSQTYSRRQDYTILSTLAGLAATAHKFAFDLRFLQSEMVGEMAEPFGDDQVGSSAMPFKRNPVQAEKIDSLARVISTAPLTAWHNHANSLLERTLDDSANRRTLYPETFLAVDEILMSLTGIMKGLQVNPCMMQNNLQKFGPFSALERILLAAAKYGADRQEMHEVLRQISLQAWQAIQSGQKNPLLRLLSENGAITSWIKLDEITRLMNVEDYTGMAESSALKMAHKILAEID